MSRMDDEKIDDEIMRRYKVADEKLAGSIIEMIEKMRKKPTVQSIALRLYYLNNSIDRYRNVINQSNIKNMDSICGPMMKEFFNIQINTYNDIVQDIKTNLSKRDKMVSRFHSINISDDPTINEALLALYKMSHYITQMLSYLVRWTGVKVPEK